jgi:cytochrome c oxidase cbb3-type subunit 1
MSAACTPTSPPVAPAEIDASCRVPLVLLFCCAACWLAAGSALGLVASIKFHAPALLANHGWQTYGRIHPAATNALVYGFALQAGFGVALWLLARLGRVKLAGPGLVVIAALLWNFGVKLGLLGILRGGSTGFERLEMPRNAWPILFTAGVLLGLSALRTFQRRRQPELFPAQWFLLAAVFWFPWIYSTANVLLVCVPVRGVAQAAVNFWFANNLVTLCLGFLGLGAIFYFVPKIIGRPLHSHYLAMFAFWTLALFGSWAGVPPGAPLPAWLPSVSTMFAVLTLLPVAAVAVNLHRTFDGQYARLASDPPLAFIVFGLFAWIGWSVLGAVTSIREVSTITHFTWLVRAQWLLAIFGFVAMTMLGAIYYIVPRLVPGVARCPKLMHAHLGLNAAGVLLVFVPLAIGGVREGLAMNQPDVPFPEVMKLTLLFLRVSTLGDLLLAVGNLLLVVNLGWMLLTSARARLVPAWKALATVPPQPAEATP